MPSQSNMIETSKDAPKRVRFTSDYCLRRYGSDCARCTYVCSTGALTTSDDGLAINQDLCTKCGLCWGVCDALSAPNLTLDGLNQVFIRNMKAGKRTTITCKENLDPEVKPASNVVVLPCLASISPELWAVLLAEQVDFRICCNLKLCHTCSFVDGEFAYDLFSFAMERAHSWTDEDIRFIRELPEAPSDQPSEQTSENASLRGFLGEMKHDALALADGKRLITSSTTLKRMSEQRIEENRRNQLRLPARYSKESQQNTALDSHGDATGSPNAASEANGLPYSNATFFPRRQMLLDALELKPDMGSKVALEIAYTSGNCNVCGACQRTCPASARYLDETRPRMETFARACIGCALCTDACPAHAIELKETTAAQALEE